MVALRLAKAGYYDGDPEKALNASADMVMAVVQYESFVNDYERTVVDMNRENQH